MASWTSSAPTAPKNPLPRSDAMPGPRNLPSDVESWPYPATGFAHILHLTLSNLALGSFRLQPVPRTDRLVSAVVTCLGERLPLDGSSQLLDRPFFHDWRTQMKVLKIATITLAITLVASV